MNSIDLTLYLVTDRLDYEEEVFLAKLESALKGGVTLVQLREKNIGGKEYLELAKKVKELTDRYAVPLIIDDRADVALAVDAAGVHVGQSDLPVLEARKLLGKEKIVGATAKTVEQAKKAWEEGADYLGIGAIYPTTTKVKTILTPVTRLDDILSEIPLPAIAIGGLNKENMHVLAESPVSGIAVVSAIMKAEDPEKAAAELKAAVQRMAGYQRRMCRL